jgi:hypothetical protein
MNAAMIKNYESFMAALQFCDPPLVAYYSNEKPAVHTGPRGGFSIDIGSIGDIFSLLGNTRRLMREKSDNFRCLFQFIARTRKNKTPSVFDHDNFGCPGCRFYLGFIDELPKFNHHFISTGFPGLYRGERFAPTPQSAKRHADMLKGIEPSGKYVIFESIENMTFDIDPEVVIFFSNVEMISALVALVRFVTDQPDAVQSPFTSGCGSIFSMPLKFGREGLDKGVLGVFDPAARPYMALGDMTLSVPYGLFKKMLASYKKSFINAEKMKSGLIKEAVPGWPNVRKRADKARRAFSKSPPSRG